MKTLIFIAIALVAGCGASTKRGISLADVAGTWDMRAFSMTSDSVLATYRLWIPNDTVWRMKFSTSRDTVRVHVLSVDGDSIRVQVGPYDSALRPGVRVTSFSTYRLHGDTLVGQAVARYTVTTADSVRRVRNRGTRHIDWRSAVREIVTSARYCTFVTMDGEQPVARVVDPHIPDSTFTIWIGTNARSRKVEQLSADQHATMLCFDASRRAYVSFVGSAALVTDAAEKARRWKSDWEGFYDDDFRGSDFALIRLDPKRLEISSSAHGIRNDSLTWRPVIIDLR